MSSTPVAFVFPGQGSQKPGMGSAAFAASDSARHVFAEVSAAVDQDVAALCFESDEETLRLTQNAQIALFTTSVAVYRSLGWTGRTVAMAGHSVGEYAALVCSGALALPDGARLVKRRGDLMARAGQLRPGTMAAVLGLDDGDVERVCAECSTGGHEVVVANYNSPGQVVISGDIAAVEAASETLKSVGAKRVVSLNVSGAFHSPLMTEAAAAMGEALRQVTFATGDWPVISNVTSEPETDWASLLTRQLESPVRWTASVRRMASMGAETFVECGSGDVLTGLLRRIAPDARGVSVSQANDLVGVESGAAR